MKYNKYRNPIGIEKKSKSDNKLSETEYEENNKTEKQWYCTIIRNSDKQSLVKENEMTITIGSRNEPIEYIQELKELN